MAGTAISGDGLSSNIAGMSKNQLYDIMKQMKTLIEQNQQQARQILVQNHTLTRALFQAQIMLGMVHPPQVIPNIQPADSQQTPRVSSQVDQSVSIQTTLQETSSSHAQIPLRKQIHSQPAIPTTSDTVPMSIPSFPPHLAMQQPKAHLNIQASQMSLPQSSHIPDLPALPLHSGSLPSSSLHQQPQMANTSSQLQQLSLQAGGFQQHPLQPPLPQQPRPPSVPNYHHQLSPQMGPNMGFQHSAPPQMHHSQPMFHSGAKPPTLPGPPFPQGPTSFQNQQQPQSIYQGGSSHMTGDFNNSAGNSMHMERAPSWMPGPPENISGSQLPGPPPLVNPSQMGSGNQPLRPPPLSPEMEKALLQQVMSLTQEQINLLPPEQRNQVLQLQQMLR